MPIPLIVWGIGAAAAAVFTSGCSDKEDGKTDKSKLVREAQAALENAPKNACRDGYAYIPAGAYELMKPQNPQRPDNGDYKVLRGGSWFSSLPYMRAAATIPVSAALVSGSVVLSLPRTQNNLIF